MFRAFPARAAAYRTFVMDLILSNGQVRVSLSLSLSLSFSLPLSPYLYSLLPLSARPPLLFLCETQARDTAKYDSKSLPKKQPDVY